MNQDYDAVILGQGVAGLGCAIALAKRGQKVLVLEKTGLKGQATPASAGILDPILEMQCGNPLLDMKLQALAKFPARIRRLERQTRIQTGYRRMGLLFLAMNGREEKIIRRWAAWYRSKDITLRWLDAVQLRSKFPFISRAARAAVYYPNFGKINPRRLRRALQVRARQLGVQFRQFDGDAQALTGRKGVEAFEARGQFYRTRAVVNAMGSWAPRGELWGIRVPLEPVRGQILILKGKMRLPVIVESVGGHYIVPWDQGRFLLGSTLERAGFRAVVTRRGLKNIRKGVERLIPAVKGLAAETSWSGLRPCTRDCLPVIGPDTVRGLYWAAGYYRSGILIGMDAGELLAQVILTGRIPESLKAFQPRRFLKK